MVGRLVKNKEVWSVGEPGSKQHMAESNGTAEAIRDSNRKAISVGKSPWHGHHGECQATLLSSRQRDNGTEG